MLLLVVAKLRAGELESVQAMRERILGELGRSPGFKGLTVWRSVTTKGRHLVAVETGAPGDPEVAMREDFALADALQFLRDPARVLRLQTIERHGPLLKDSPLGTYLSTSDRIAEPGMDRELIGDLRSVFDELRLMEGCLGTQIYQNEALAEELLGLVTWTKKEAFERSLPTRQPYVVRLYDRIG